jgi:cobalamin biosynthesis protein CbiG
VIGLVVGLGCRRGAGAGAVRAAVDALLARHGADPRAIRAYATLEARAAEPGLRAVAGDLLLAYPAAVLAEVDVPNPSATVLAATGTPSVAEAAAVHAARLLASPGAAVELVGEKLVSGGVTAALARIGRRDTRSRW